MRKKEFLIFCVSMILIYHNICISSEKPPEPKRYILGSILGEYAGVFVALGGSRLFGLISGEQNGEKGMVEAPYILGIAYIGLIVGTSIGTTIVAQNKTKVFLTNFAAAAIPIGLLSLSDKTIILACYYAALVVPVFSAINAYRIDKHEYEKREHLSQSRYFPGYTGLMKNPIESVIQREIINERQNYTPMGQRINVVKMPLLSVNW